MEAARDLICGTDELTQPPVLAAMIA